MKTLAWKASVSRSTVLRHLPKLEEAKKMRIQPRMDGKQRLTHMYWLNCCDRPRSSEPNTDVRDTRGCVIAATTENHHLNHYNNTKLDNHSRKQEESCQEVGTTSKVRERTRRTSEQLIAQETQNELARRLGVNGWEILLMFPEEIGQLGFKMRRRQSIDPELELLRLRFAHQTKR
jgi:hypothetical protein